jgi:hypothetical protein
VKTNNDSSTLCALHKSALISLAVAAIGINGAAVGAPPSFDNPSPTADGSTSKRANEMTDKAAYKAVDYENASRKGPQVVVLPGQVKSNNATFTQRFLPTNIADFAELELGRANFGVLERNELGPLMREIHLAYDNGDRQAAQKALQRGNFKATRWVVKLDIIKAEQIAEVESGFDGRTAGNILGTFLGGKEGSIARQGVGSVKNDEKSKVWLVGMRYKIIDANTTEQVATGYHEQKMEVGATSSAVLGVKNREKGGTGLDTLVQRLVQLSVYDIDKGFKK